MTNKMAGVTWTILLIFSVTCVITHSIDSIRTTSMKVDPCQRTCRQSLVWYYRENCTSPTPYCCGDIYDQYCCSYVSRRINFNRYTTCPFSHWSTWWEAQWRVIVGMFISLVAMLCCVTGCYYCCGGEGACPCCKKHQTHRPRREREAETVSCNLENERPSVPRLFNPTSPYAFEPPAYETLPKEPPKYAEIWQAQDNAAFVDETRPEDSRSSNVGNNAPNGNVESESGLPPAYSERVEEQERGERATTSTANTVMPRPVRNEVGTASDEGQTQPNATQSATTSKENTQTKDTSLPHKNTSNQKKGKEGVSEVIIQNNEATSSSSTLQNNTNSADLVPVQIS